MDALGRLLRPRSVAVVGASADATKLTGRPVAYLRRNGFAGRIFPVNLRVDAIGDLVCYPDVASLPEAPDVGLVLLGAERVNEAVRQLAARGTAAAIVLAGGFGEGGEDGKRRQRELKEAAGAMRVLGPNTIGLVNLTDDIVLSASGALEMEAFPRGNIALVSQSGGILGSLLSRAAARDIGFSKLVATGNEADIEVAELVEHLLDDEATGVIALYLEGLRNPARFRVAAERAAALGKPIVAFKVGRSESGARSAVSHTGALAGADATYDAFFRQLGVVRAETFSDLLDVPAALATGRRLAGRRVAIVTSTGGAGTLLADAAGMAGFDTPEPDEATAERLLALDIRDAELDRNPIDVTLAGLRPDLFRGAIGALLDSPSYDAVIVVIGSSALGAPDLVARPLIEALATSDKPLIAYVSPDAPAILRHLNANGAPAFAAPESCAAALSAMLHVSRRRTIPSVQSGAVSELPELPPGALNEAESKALFARFGVPVVTEEAAGTPEEAEAAAQRIGERVVVKILSRAILHKTEVGGVAVGIHLEEVRGRCEEMAARIGAAHPGAVEGFLVQEMVGGGTEMILGAHRDPQLGVTILLGLGGVTAKLFQDTAIRLPPVDAGEAAAMVAELKASALLAGFRGRPKGDVAALVRAVSAFSDMVMALGDRLVEAEINPLFVLPEGQGARAADGLVVLR